MESTLHNLEKQQNYFVYHVQDSLMHTAGNGFFMTESAMVVPIQLLEQDTQMPHMKLTFATSVIVIDIDVFRNTRA